ncbi:EfeM/EfeO family lipoprotein [Streptacidiphilus sp. PB12-B1b]|uniref:EfeM/EfeO family lipoprotein n=1 Tax=Streptacidiphilus sp. PB12-B1b TaxID=2705012 RepID=UPI0015FA8F82|nr:EfeM/EfeO family lipoprotein [Streptacidiphilus sp. PB12-B1b]QMU75956.1 EfeM/EfeO family lipoprotein [Streptacidiphilus sp. PB12-B1b]
MTESEEPGEPGGRPRWRRPWLVAGAAAAVVALGAGAVAYAHGSSPAKPAAPQDGYPGLPHTTVDIASDTCGRGWTAPHTGLQVFDLVGTGPVAADAYLETAAGAVVGEVESLSPGTTRPFVVRLAAGSYTFQCLPQDEAAVKGPVVKVAGSGGGSPAVVPVTQQDLIPPTLAYEHWVSTQLPGLVRDVDTLQAAVAHGDLAAARTDWLPAHLDYERLGAAYDAFGPLDGSINGTTQGLPDGLTDPGFTGFHRLEYGLWHGQSASALAPVAATLGKDVRALQAKWPTEQMDPLLLGLRAHEIVENAVQFELTGRTDYGSGSNLATVGANLQGTQEALTLLKPLLSTRMTTLPQINADMAAAEAELAGLGGAPLGSLPTTRREQLNAVFGQLVDDLAPVAAVCDVRRTS